MKEHAAHKAVAIVGVGAILPDAPNASVFWDNVKKGVYSVREVPSGRWDPRLYFDADPRAPEKTYSKIGGWVEAFDWDPRAWHLPIPPRVADAMDRGQKWAIAAVREALTSFGYPSRKLDGERTAVILGNAMGGDKHYLTALRVFFPEIIEDLGRAPAFASLDASVRAAIIEQTQISLKKRLPEINEDTMPGELSNVLAGRIAALFDFHGPNYVCDAACASAMAAINAAIEGLEEGDFDAVITGGVDANMSASSFVKFCKIGALSATGTRPYADGADGFVMGEGAAIFLLKRLDDAERDGDPIVAVIRGVGGSSDGKGKGITAPNPIGQKLAVERAWRNAGVSPETASLIEGHGTSTRVGDVVEVTSIAEVFAPFGLRPGSIPLGSVKSNIGHLKAAAGAAGILKATLALRDKILPPSLGFQRPNPSLDFSKMPFRVNTELRPWEEPAAGVRRAGVSAFGFGGTNFHTVLEEYVPGRIAQERGSSSPKRAAATSSRPAALRQALVLGAASEAELAEALRRAQSEVKRGAAPRSPQIAQGTKVRLAIDWADLPELDAKIDKALVGFARGEAVFSALRAQGIFLGRGAPGKVAFLFTGQGSQYPNMLAELRGRSPVVAQTFAEADEVMRPLLGQSLTDLIFVDPNNPTEMKRAEQQLKQTAITQPAVLATDIALFRLLGEHGIKPDMVMGHSLGEYGALVAAGGISFANALKAVSARGAEMTRVSVADNGAMLAVFAPFDEIEKILATIPGYVVIANINSRSQAVIGGETASVHAAATAFERAGYRATPLIVSHAFHTKIVAPASGPLRRVLETLDLRPVDLPLVSNVTGELYPSGANVVPEMIELLGRQIESPVQFVRGLETLYAAGARVFIETGPKRALVGLAEDVLAKRSDVTILGTNHPKVGDVVSFQHALCGLYAAGLGLPEEVAPLQTTPRTPAIVSRPRDNAPSPSSFAPVGAVASRTDRSSSEDERHRQIGRMFADVLERSMSLLRGESGRSDLESRQEARVVVTGAGLGLPGGAHVFSDDNAARILRGEQLIEKLPLDARRSIAGKHVTRLVKSDQGGGPRFETIEGEAEVIKLAGQGHALDLAEEFGVPAERVPALDITTKLAIGAGLEALRDAGIPLVLNYKTTTRGTKLPERWMLPEPLRDETGIIFGSAFPGYDAFATDMDRLHADLSRRERIADLEAVRARTSESVARAEIDRRLSELRAGLAIEPYTLDRRFLFRVLAMGHSQFAEYIGARGPNTQLNGACASGVQAIALAQDWIRAGRCRRVIVITADDVTTDHLIQWIGAGFLASGAAATDDDVKVAALPFDRRRHGMLLGMGATALVIEREDVALERGLSPICEILGSVVANSAFHGSRLDVEHISAVMESLVAGVSAREGIDRAALARELVFVSHETYTPARGGSAQAEIVALRRVFGDAADRVVIANTKGFTGHAMGAGIEDVVAVRMLETGLVPPVANFQEVDPELGNLNLSRGGAYPIRYALRLAAGFGSQISMMLLRWCPPPSGAHVTPETLGFEGRVMDKARHQAWLASTAGRASPELEVVRRTLRVKDAGTAPVVATSRVMPEAKKAEIPKQVSAPRPAGDAVRDKVIAIVSEQTGYPADMLDVELDLEADLGVDTVKQAETFAAVRETYDIPRDANLKLKDFPTLAHVIRWVKEKRPELAAPTAVTTEAPKPAATSSVDPVREKVIAIVSEQTGYPADMLDVELDLEADLGVDTVKQAETFAAVRETYDIPRDANLKLKDFPTLAHVIRWVKEKRPELAAPTAVTAEASKPAATSSADPVRDKVIAIVSEQTGYPADMLDVELDLEADLGVDTVKQAETFAAVRETYDIPRDANLKLKDFPTLAHVIRWVKEKRPELAVAEAPEAVEAVGASATSSADPVRDKVVSIVSEQTGYPADMLDVELDLEADLGVDTVKQAETFAAVRETYDIPRDANLKLKDFPTLAHVIQWVKDKRPDLAVGAPAQAVTPALTAPTPAVEIRTPRRVPVAVLRPALEACSPSGIALERGSRVIVMSDASGEVAAALRAALEGRGVSVTLISGSPSPEELSSAVKREGPVAGLYWLPAVEAGVNLLDTKAVEEALRVRVKLLYHAARALYDDLASPTTFVVAATRLGGRHGYGGEIACPLGGAVTGFIKTLARERREALIKAVDFDGATSASEIARLMVGETLADRAVVEVGHADGLRVTIALEERPLPKAESFPLKSDSVVVVTGAAGSIVSAIIADLAKRTRGGTFYLCDLAAAPNMSDPDLALFRRDRDALKSKLVERAKASGERVTPAMIDRELARFERLASSAAAVTAIEAAGGTAEVRSLDLRDEAAITRVIDEVRTRHGRVDLLIHAAGLEISHFLPDKSPEELDRVFDVKVNGFFSIWRALGDTPLGSFIAFSSIAGRFGNAGQADYAAANDLLCKMALATSARRSEARGLAIDWTAWAGIGMASRGSIPKMMQVAGIDMLPAEEGIPIVARELASGAEGEVVIAGRLGVLLEERDPLGGLTRGAVAAKTSLPMVGSVVSWRPSEGLRLEVRLDPKEQPFLYDHAIEGTPVLPGVMSLEAFTEAALLTAPKPDEGGRSFRLAAVEDAAFLAPFKFYRSEPRTLTIIALPVLSSSNEVVVHCQLIGERTLPSSAEPQRTVHASARVRLSSGVDSIEGPPRSEPPVAHDGAKVGRDDIYRVFFHGPAYQVLAEAFREDGVVVGRLTESLPQDHSPASTMVLEPRLLELCFQTAGVYEIGTTGRMGLPTKVERVTTYGAPESSKVWAEVTPRGDGAFDAQVIDSGGRLLAKLEGYRTIAFGQIDEEQRRPIAGAMS